MWKDCIYVMYFVMYVFKSMKGLWFCEGGLLCGVISVSYVVGVVYFLEKWMYNEVGFIDVECIDIVWVVVLKYGF